MRLERAMRGEDETVEDPEEEEQKDKLNAEKNKFIRNSFLTSDIARNLRN